MTSSVDNLHSVGFGDSASSICVPAGWRVTLYEDTRYRGEVLELTGPRVIYDLKRDRPQGRDWGDRISSVEITRLRRGGADCNRYPILYGDDGYRGNRYEIRDSIRDLHRARIGNEASSLCVPSSWRVTFYENKGYGGGRLIIDGYESINDLKRDRPGGRDWGDRISSVRVERNRRDTPPPRSSDPDRGRRPPRGREDSQVRCDYPTFYLNSNFRGRSLVLDNSISDLHARGFGDQISSACIPSGWTLSLYSDRSYRGQHLHLEGDSALADLNYDAPDRQNWEDRISSIRVESRGGFNRLPGIRLPGDQGNPGDRDVRCEVPVLFSNDSFGGRSLEVRRSIPDLHRQGFGDEASSVCVPPGWEIVLYSETNYRGLSLAVRSGQDIIDMKRNRPSS